MRPFGVFAEEGDAEKIRAHEQRQQGAGGITRGQGVGKKRDAEDAEQDRMRPDACGPELLQGG